MTRQERPTDVTMILERIEGGDAQAAEELLPLVYEELRRLARERLRQEKPGQTLQATALVHEAYLRLVGKLDPGWNGRGHFFTAAAEAMRRVLIDTARRKATEKYGGGAQRVSLDPSLVPEAADPASTLDLAEALEGLEQQDAEAAAVVKLRFFAGLSIPETARVLGFSPRKVDDLWAYARAWLMQRLREETRSGSPKHPSQ